MRRCAGLGAALLVATAPVITSAAACSSFSATDAPDSGAEGGEGIVDAGPPVADAAPDAADTGRFCGAHQGAQVCADFEEGKPVVDNFTSSQGNVSVVMGGAGGSSMAMSANTVGAPAYLRYNPAAPLATHAQTLSFDLFLSTVDAKVSDYFAGLVWGTGSRCEIDLEFLPGTAAARLALTVPSADGGAAQVFFTYSMQHAPVLNAWSRVSLGLSGGSSGVVATVTVDDVVALDGVVTACKSLDPVPSVFVGFNRDVTAEARYDNVLFEVE